MFDPRDCVRSSSKTIEASDLTSDGSSAVDLTRSKSFDVIFMDVNLAGPMDGVETARLIRERSGVPIVFVTAYAGYDDIAVELEKIGASVVVGKPTMADAVESALRRMGLRP